MAGRVWQSRKVHDMIARKEERERERERKREREYEFTSDFPHLCPFILLGLGCASHIQGKSFTLS
jgi:hypothetical protein